MKNRTNSTLTTAASVAAEMRAQVARELPTPAKFRSKLHRKNFQIARDLLFATLQADLEDFLSRTCGGDDAARQAILAAFRAAYRPPALIPALDASHLLNARN